MPKIPSGTSPVPDHLKPARVLREPAVRERYQVSRVTLHRWVCAKEFPAPIRLGGRTIAWVEAELDAWDALRPRVRYAEAA